MRKKDRKPKLTGKAFEKPSPGIIDSDEALVRWVRDIVKNIDEPSKPASCDLTDPSFQAACFQVASSIIGADEHKIGNLLGFDDKLVAEWARNLRQNGLWLPEGTVVHDHWFDPRGGAMGFIMDLLVARGLIQCWLDPVKGRVYDRIAGRHVAEVN